MATFKNRLQFLGLLAALVALVFGAVPLGASTLGPGAAYTAPLSGGEEVPPRTTPAGGEATFQVSADGQSLTYTVTVRDITNVTMGHIHLAPAGANGDIILPLVAMMPPAGGPKSGVIGQGTATAAQLVGPMQGKTLAELVAEMDAGNTYVNIHTAGGTSPATLQPGDIPPGEIRGQIRLANAAQPGTMPRTGGGYGARPTPLPWLALASVLTLVAAVVLRRTARRAG
jgi:hypothetical protein